jgi:amidase
MGNFPEYEKYDGLALAKLVQEKQVTPLELLEEAISRAEKFKKLNTIIYQMYDLARKEAGKKLPEGPFTGVPTLLKDLIADYKGTPISYGSRALRNNISKIDSELVKRFKATGVVIFGKTNAPEFGIMGTTEPEHFKPCRNPWDLKRSTGGSSGGSAAAIAAGIVPFAHGGDGGGSIRIPSSMCGLFGFKPSRGLTPIGPSHGEIMDGAVVQHILSRSVRDSAAMLDATMGNEFGSPYKVILPKEKLLETQNLPSKKLKIAYSIKSIIGENVHPDVVEAFKHTLDILKGLGHELVEDQPNLDGEKLSKAYLINLAGHISNDVEEAKKLVGAKVALSELETLTKTLALIGRNLTALEFIQAKNYWHEVTYAMDIFHQKYDVYLTPVVAIPPPLLGSQKLKPVEVFFMKIINFLGTGRALIKSGIVEKIAKESFEKFPFTQISNLAGTPSMSVPLYWNKDNLPIGSLFSAKWGDEPTLFRLAFELEKSSPWFNKRPKILI